MRKEKGRTTNRGLLLCDRFGFVWEGVTWKPIGHISIQNNIRILVMYRQSVSGSGVSEKTGTTSYYEYNLMHVYHHSIMVNTSGKNHKERCIFDDTGGQKEEKDDRCSAWTVLGGNKISEAENNLNTRKPMASVFWTGTARSQGQTIQI
jgi:hypothetical protein